MTNNEVLRKMPHVLQT